MSNQRLQYREQFCFRVCSQIVVADPAPYAVDFLSAFLSGVQTFLDISLGARSDFCFEQSEVCFTYQLNSRKRQMSCLVGYRPAVLQIIQDVRVLLVKSRLETPFRGSAACRPKGLGRGRTKRLFL